MIPNIVNLITCPGPQNRAVFNWVSKVLTKDNYFDFGLTTVWDWLCSLGFTTLNWKVHVLYNWSVTRTNHMQFAEGVMKSERSMPKETRHYLPFLRRKF